MPAGFRLRQTLGEILERLEPLARSREVSLRPVILPEVGEVRLDPGRFDQVVSHLVDNALRFTRSGGQVEVVVCLRESDLVELQVIDTGVGMPADLVGRLSSSHRPPVGGLTRTRRLVEAEGGSLRLQSEPGIGTAVIVRMPQAAASLEPSRLPALYQPPG